MKVHAVSSGEYSDYSVACIFALKSDAIKHAANLNGITAKEQKLLQQVEENWQLKHASPYREVVQKAGYNRSYVESFDFYSAGKVPSLERS